MKLSGLFCSEKGKTLPPPLCTTLRTKLSKKKSTTKKAVLERSVCLLARNFHIIETFCAYHFLATCSSAATGCQSCFRNTNAYKKCCQMAFWILENSQGWHFMANTLAIFAIYHRWWAMGIGQKLQPSRNIAI